MEVNDSGVKELFPALKDDAMGRGGGQVVSVLAFYSDNPSSNTAGVVLATNKLSVQKDRNQ